MESDFFHCCFCGSTKLRMSYQKQEHPAVPEIGQFTIYRCSNCSSLLTCPVPEAAMLEKLYRSFDGGIQGKNQQLRSESPLDALYIQSIRRAISSMPFVVNKDTAFTWLDVGAGDGILSDMLAKRYPKARGIAIDYHTRPQRLDDSESVKWIRADLNTTVLQTIIDRRSIDLVISLAVLEHVQDPSHFIANLLPLVSKRGMVYVACPAVDSFAAKLMGRKWPYFIPGEHINIPSKKGCCLMFQELLARQTDLKFQLSVKSIFAPYPIKYLFSYFGARRFAKFISPDFTCPLPSGVLEAKAISVI